MNDFLLVQTTDRYAHRVEDRVAFNPRWEGGPEAWCHDCGLPWTHLGDVEGLSDLPPQRVVPSCTLHLTFPCGTLVDAWKA